MAKRKCIWIMTDSDSGRAETDCEAIFEDVSEIYSNDRFEYCSYCKGQIEISEEEIDEKE